MATKKPVTETPRQASIRILSNLSAITKTDFERLGKIEASGYLDGTVFRDLRNNVTGSNVRGLSLSGEEYLHELKEEESKATFRHRITKYGLPILSAIGGGLFVLFQPALQERATRWLNGPQAPAHIDVSVNNALKKGDVSAIPSTNNPGYYILQVQQ